MISHSKDTGVLYLKCIICFSLLLLLFIQAGNAQVIAPEEIIPAYSSSCILVSDVSKIANAIKASPPWQELTKSAEKELEKNSGEMPSLTKFVAPNMWDILALAADRIAIVHTDPENMDSPCIIIDMGDAKSALEITQKVLGLLSDKEKDNIVPNAGTFLDVPYGIVKPDGRFAFLNNLFIYAPKQDIFESVINVYRDEEPSIVGDPKFIATTSKLTSAGELLIYINSEVANPVSQVLSRNEPMKLLGTGDVKATACKINLLSTTRDMEFYMYSGYTESLMASMLSQTVPLLSPHIIPLSNSDIFYAFQAGSLAMVFDRFMDSVKSTMTEEEFNQIQNGLQDFEQTKGLNIRNDILDLLTGEIGVAFAISEPSGEMEGMGTTMQKGIMLFIGIRDSTKATMCIERLFPGKPMDQTQYNGVEIRYIPSFNGPEGPFGYIFADNLMVFSSIKKLMKVIDEDPPLVTSESFTEIGTRLSEPSSALFYIDLKKILSHIPPPANQSEESLLRLQEIGSIGGSMSYDGVGYKTIITGNQAKNWLDITGSFIDMTIKRKAKD